MIIDNSGGPWLLGVSTETIHVVHNVAMICSKRKHILPYLLDKNTSKVYSSNSTINYVIAVAIYLCNK